MTLPVAGVFTLVASGIAVAEGAGDEPERPRALMAAPPEAEAVSRGAQRPALEQPTVVASRWVTMSTHVRSAPTVSARVVGTLRAGTPVAVTAQVVGQWQQVKYADAFGWMLAENLSATEPMTFSAAACASGSGVEAGLTARTIGVHRAVCAAFPQITRYGGLGAGEHATGRALDIMVATDLGNAVAEFLIAHHTELGVTEVIWRQRIWTTQRAGEGWRPMSNRGSATANHMDHVHVTTA